MIMVNVERESLSSVNACVGSIGELFGTIDIFKLMWVVADKLKTGFWFSGGFQVVDDVICVCERGRGLQIV